MDPFDKYELSHLFIRRDCEAAIAIMKNKSYNYKIRHMKLTHHVVKPLLKDEIIAIGYVTYELNFFNSLTKLVGRKLIHQTSIELGLRSIDSKQRWEPNLYDWRYHEVGSYR